MTTSTLELVDWATILDDEPACESVRESCSRGATWIWHTAGCGCIQFVCAEHKRRFVECLAGRIYPGWGYCVLCCRERFALGADDVGRWTPL